MDSVRWRVRKGCAVRDICNSKFLFSCETFLYGMFCSNWQRDTTAACSSGCFSRTPGSMAAFAFDVDLGPVLISNEMYVYVVFWVRNLDGLDRTPSLRGMGRTKRLPCTPRHREKWYG